MARQIITLYNGRIGMRRRRTFLIVFAVLVLILVVGVTALVLMSRGAPELPPDEGDGLEPLPTPEPEMEPVVIVVQPIRRGQRIPPDAVEIRRWEVDRLPAEPVYQLEDVVGGFAAVDLTPPRPLSAKQVKKVVLGGSNVSLAIPPGKVAYSFPVRLVAAVAGALEAGDRVDVMISWNVVVVDQDLQIKLPILLVGGEDCLAGCQISGDQIPGLVTQYTVQNALVLGVDFWEDRDLPVGRPGEEDEEEPVIPIVEEEPDAEEEEIPVEEPPPQAEPTLPYSRLSVVTLAVDPQSALVLKWSVESNSAIDLVLRSAVDIQEFAQPEAVTLEYMVHRYQISLPPKLPNAPENIFEYRIIQAAEEALKPPEE
jgi:Flp pilus assembly protein CpaB